VKTDFKPSTYLLDAERGHHGGQHAAQLAEYARAALAFGVELAGAVGGALGLAGHLALLPRQRFGVLRLVGQLGAGFVGQFAEQALGIAQVRGGNAGALQGGGQRRSGGGQLFLRGGGAVVVCRGALEVSRGGLPRAGGFLHRVAGLAHSRGHLAGLGGGLVLAVAVFLLRAAGFVEGGLSRGELTRQLALALGDFRKVRAEAL